jgi:hypothetical protein
LTEEIIPIDADKDETPPPLPKVGTPVIEQPHAATKMQAPGTPIKQSTPIKGPQKEGVEKAEVGEESPKSTRQRDLEKDLLDAVGLGLKDGSEGQGSPIASIGEGEFGKDT